MYMLFCVVKEQQKKVNSIKSQEEVISKKREWLHDYDDMIRMAEDATIKVFESQQLLLMHIKEKAAQLRAKKNSK